MHIKQVAQKLHTTSRTIRYYEEKGLIKPEKSHNDYRIFREEQIQLLQTILSLREIGMSTNQIKNTMENGQELDHHLNHQRSILYSDLLELKDMIGALDEMIASPSGDLFEKAKFLKELKEKRQAWTDRWSFDQQAVTYNVDLKKEGYAFNVHEGYDEALERAYQLIDASVGETGVDIGIGTGNLGSRFLEKGSRIIGIDQSDEMLAICKSHYPEIDTRHGHFLRLPVMDHSADFITTSYALHHVEEQDKILALEEMNRILKPFGRLVIADLMFDDDEERARVLQAFKNQGNENAIEAIEDEYYADRSRLVSNLENLGFQVDCNKINDILHIVFAEKKG
ncbi:MerR family transcriptional regulator [Halobacillus salinus]|uniref:MerR family transcriptional regulator n=1 Tax=Halobacillus salinus TaxID=192814 RepID=UPI001305253E|nr:MerR family transcriptional regulator [Halobacillus salinus]